MTREISGTPSCGGLHLGGLPRLELEVEPRGTPGHCLPSSATLVLLGAVP